MFLTYFEILNEKSKELIIDRKKTLDEDVHKH